MRCLGIILATLCVGLTGASPAPASKFWGFELSGGRGGY